MQVSQNQRLHKIDKITGLFIENRTRRFKAFYFLFFFGCGTLRNYLPVYFKHIGLSALLTGVLTGVRPFTGFVSAPVFSFLADKTGSHKFILLIALIVSVLSYFSLSFVAIVRQIENSRETHCLINKTNPTELASQQLHHWKTYPFNETSEWKIDQVSQVYNPAKLAKKRSKVRNTSEKKGKKHPRTEQSADQHFDRNLKSMEPNTDNNSSNSNSTNIDACGDTIFSKTTIFFASFALLIVADFFNAPVGAIMSSTVIYWEGSSQFGKQRVFGAIGFGFGSFLAGIAIDQTFHFNYFDGDPLKTDEPNYFTAFLMYLCANVLLFLLISRGLDVAREEKTKIMWSRVKEILSDWMVVCFLLYVFVMGVVGGVIVLFLFWYLESLGASQTLLGLSSGVMSLSEIPVFILTSKMIKCIGHVGVFGLSLTVLVFRMTFYSLLTNPWYVLLIEPFHGITLAAMWSASISFGSRISSPELYTTMEGVITGIHFGLGWGLGSVLGGLFYHSYGPRILFRGCIVLCGLCYILLALIYKLKRRKNSIIDKVNDSLTTSINTSASDYEFILGENVL